MFMGSWEECVCICVSSNMCMGSWEECAWCMRMCVYVCRYACMFECVYVCICEYMLAKRGAKCVDDAIQQKCLFEQQPPLAQHLGRLVPLQFQLRPYKVTHIHQVHTHTHIHTHTKTSR